MTAPTQVDDDTATKVRTSLNCGANVLDAAVEHGISPHVVRRLAKRRHTLRPDTGAEGQGRVLHHVEAERWADRPQRHHDAARRTAAREARDKLLRRYGLEPRDNSIAIVPGVAPSVGDWKARSRRGVKAQRARLALEKAGRMTPKKRAVKTFADFDDGN